MFKSREQKEYEARLDALKREKEILQSQAAALAAEQREQRFAEERQQPGTVRQEMPLAYWLGWKVAQDTRGSARLDLVRPRFPAVEPTNLLRRRAPSLPLGTTRDRPGEQRRQHYQHDPYDQPAPLLGFGQGARIKVMRHIDFNPPNQRRLRQQPGLQDRELNKKGLLNGNAYSDRQHFAQHEPDFGAAVSSIGDALKHNFKPPEKPWFDFGAGVNLELDDGSLQPTVRLKVKDFFSIKLLPEPMFKIQKRLRFGDSALGLRVNYELPLVDARNLWAPPARLMVRVDNTAGGLKVGPGGADFDEHVLQLGKSTAVRAALSVDFPRTLPLEEGEKAFGWRARRLGIKSRW